MTASEYYNFRVRANQWVEVIVHAVREDEDLRWVMEGNYDISLSADHYGERVIHEDGRITRKIEQRCPESGFLVVGVMTGRESATKPMPSSYSYQNN